jgi:hypothetical protein
MQVVVLYDGAIAPSDVVFGSQKLDMAMLQDVLFFC